ncbi:MAG: glutaminyl-peptide cyclotransferase, partial [Candidatus Hydrogenedens sp.]|nr:glutaminyl-peptide cyclotransferase [Candidatus Hydrogenedens sp.]
DGRRFIMSDGTATLRFLDRRDFSVTGTLAVTDDGNPVARLNELEWVDGMVWANVWRTDRVAMIDPGDGRVRGWLDLSGILKDADRAGATVDVLNGIAHDPDSGRLWVTGKLWPKLYEIRLVEKPAPAP